MLVTHMIIQRESENTIQKSDDDFWKKNKASEFDFEKKQCVRFWVEKNTTWQILN